MTDISVKKTAMQAASEEIRKIVMVSEGDIVLQLHSIIGDLSFVGYVIARCKLNGLSHQQCANNLGITKETVRYYHEKCVELQHDIALKKLLALK